MTNECTHIVLTRISEHFRYAVNIHLGSVTFKDGIYYGGAIIGIFPYTFPTNRSMDNGFLT
jgi:hypothetical protein